MVKIGIKITLAIIEIMFNVLKKYAIIITIAIVVDKLIAIGLISFSFIFVLLKAFFIGEYNIAIPITHEKLSKNATSNIHNGLIKKITIPAIEIELNGSYSFLRIPAISTSIDIILALTIETA